MLRDGDVQGCNLVDELGTAGVDVLELVGFGGELVNLGQELFFISVHESSFLIGNTELGPRGSFLWGILSCLRPCFGASCLPKVFLPGVGEKRAAFGVGRTMTRHPRKGAARERRVSVRELIETRAPRETIPVRFAARQTAG